MVYLLEMVIFDGVSHNQLVSFAMISPAINLDFFERSQPAVQFPWIFSG
jgi:hypothetical protein